MKVALIGSTDLTIWNYRRGLIKALLQKGRKVYVISPDGPYVKQILNLGARHIAVDINRFSNPFKDLLFCIKLFLIFRRERFDIVHTFSVKPNIYGAISAWAAGIKKIICSVTGRGYIFFEKNNQVLNPQLLLGKLLYRLSCGFASRVWFQNQDDFDFFVQAGLIKIKKAVLIRSSGINLEEFSSSNVNPDAVARLKNELGSGLYSKFVTMPSRMMWCKGVKEFIEASKEIKDKIPDVKFLCVGETESDNPLSVPEKYLYDNSSANFQWLGFREDIKEILALSDIIVLLSYYTEGIPRSLLEAMAMAKPIITTNHTGCRETVENGKNGFLVPVKDTRVFSRAIMDLIYDEDKKLAFGKYSLAKAKKEFDERIVISRMMSDLYQIE